MLYPYYVTYSTFSNAKIKAYFYETGEGEVLFELTIFPNSGYPTLFVLLPLLFLVVLFNPPGNIPVIVFDMLIVLLMVASGFIIAWLGKFSKTHLLNKCIQLFELKPL